MAIFITGSIMTASTSTQLLLENKQQVDTSYQRAKNENSEVERLKKSIWAKCPRWAMASIAGLTGLISFPAFTMVFFVFFHRSYEKFCS
jgi:hypothetical protein